MKKTTKILLPTDFSEPAANAFKYALQLADHLGAMIELLHVIYPQGESLDFPTMVEQATQAQTVIARKQLKDFVKQGSSQVLETLNSNSLLTSTIEVGTPFSTIARICRRDEIDLVIMGSRGTNRSGLDKLIGSVAAKVASELDFPVLIVPEDATFQPIKNLGYASEVLDQDPFEIWKSLQLLYPFLPNIHIVHFNFDRNKDESDWEKMESMKNLLDSKEANREVTLHHIPGKNLEKDFNAFIKLQNIDLLTMYRPQQNLWKRLTHKSLTKKMAIHSHTPLLIQK